MNRTLPLGLVLLCVLASAAHAVPFSFTLAQGSKTSAGVFSGDGTLIKTLWSGVSYAAGSYQKDWDGTDDAGHLAPDGKYQVRVLTSHCTYTWEGVVGNTSTASTGPTVFNPMNTAACMAVTGTTAYIAFGYNELNPSAARFDTGAVGTKTYISGAGPMYTEVATDGAHVYWAGMKPGGPGSPIDSFVMVTAVGTDAQTAFQFGKPYTVEFTKCTSTIDLITATIGAEPTGLAVQQHLHGTGNKGYLFVAHKGMNALHVVDKKTGELVKSLTFTAPGTLAVDGNDDLWMLHHGTVQHFTVNLDATGNFVSLTSGVEINGLLSPLALACNRAGTLVIADGGASQQVKAFKETGEPTWTLGQTGGYATDPTVTDEKFDFEPTLLGGVNGVFLAFQPDGSFWVEDPGDYRVQHYTSTAEFINHIAYVPISYSAGADPNNPTRVFDNFLEYKIDYSLPLGPTNGSWKLVRNWRTGVPNDPNEGYNPYTRLKYVTTLRNGRTYAQLGSNKLYELPPTGLLRNTGITLSALSMIHPDGSLRTVARANGVETWSKQTLAGFDGDNNPIWAPPVTMAAIPVGTTDPRDVDDNGGASVSVLRPGFETAGGVIISYDALNYAAGDPIHPAHRGWHLGGVRPGASTWLWKASHNVPNNYDSEYPPDGSFAAMSGNSMLFLGGAIMTVDHHILTQFVAAGGANSFNHFYDDGLFVDTFGWWWARDGAFNAPPGAAVDCYSCWLVKLADGRVYFYQSDGGEHSGLHRWRIDGLNTVAEQTSEITWTRDKVTRAGLQAEYFNTPDWNSRTSAAARVDAQLNFSWGANPPPSVTNPLFSARWTGYVQPQYKETYTFKAETDNDVRLWVDGKLVLAGAGRQTGAIALMAGVDYPIRIEYKHAAGASGSAGVVLKWSSASRSEEIIPAARLCNVSGLGVSNPSDLLFGLWSDSEVTAGASGDYGWSFTPASSYKYGDTWYARTNVRSMQTGPPVDLNVRFGKNTGTAALSRDLGVASDATTQWELAARLNFTRNTSNSTDTGGQYLDVLDDAGKVIARFYSSQVAYPNDCRLYGNTSVITPPLTSVYKLQDVMYQWQPFRITAQNGQITFQYGRYAPVVSASAFDPGANWRRAKTLRLSYWAIRAYGRAIAIEDLTFTTKQK